jgi:hypothetical protein
MSVRSCGIQNGKRRYRHYCPLCERARISQYREAIQRSKYQWAVKNPDKRQAHKAVENALRIGEMTRSPCSVCGAAEAQAHHPDYSRPLDVVWLCDKHHKAEHRRLRCEAA